MLAFSRLEHFQNGNETYHEPFTVTAELISSYFPSFELINKESVKVNKRPNDPTELANACT
jgi:hypothetical protein